jgi:phosphinothricin acetyltransferase
LAGLEVEKMELAELREKIDKIDTDIISLLAQRSWLVSAAGKLKKDEQGVRDPKRVEQVIQKVRAKAVDAGFDQDFAEEIYRTIIGGFVRKEMQEFSARAKAGPAAENGITIRKALDHDCVAITDIFNYYVEHSFAAYPDRPFDGSFFDFMKTIVHGDAFIVMETGEKKIIGFGFLKKYHPYPAFNRTAETGYFILPDYTRKGLGTRMLHALDQEARRMNIDTLLANISSLNPPSLAFHRKQGFRECGRFMKMLRKFGQDIDIVWMQKML